MITVLEVTEKIPSNSRIIIRPSVDEVLGDLENRSHELAASAQNLTHLLQNTPVSTRRVDISNQLTAINSAWYALEAEYHAVKCEFLMELAFEVFGSDEFQFDM